MNGYELVICRHFLLKTRKSALALAPSGVSVISYTAALWSCEKGEQWHPAATSQWLSRPAAHLRSIGQLDLWRRLDQLWCRPGSQCHQLQCCIQKLSHA